MKYIIFILFLFFPSLAQAKPCPKIDYIIGDSIAWMMQRNIGCEVKTFYLDAQGARTPRMILRAIVSAKKLPQRFDNVNVILSSGASNDPGRLEAIPAPQQLDKIEQQLKELSTAKTVFLLGVGPGYSNVLEQMQWNDMLATIASKYPNVIFMGPLKTQAKDPVHPRPKPHNDFPLLFKDILDKIE